MVTYIGVGLNSPVSSLTPIETATSSTFEDTITSSGDYYYVIVAGNPMGNSSISNCESVQVELGSSTETTSNTETTNTTTGIMMQALAPPQEFMP